LKGGRSEVGRGFPPTRRNDPLPHDQNEKGKKGQLETNFESLGRKEGKKGREFRGPAQGLKLFFGKGRKKNRRKGWPEGKKENEFAPKVLKGGRENNQEKGRSERDRVALRKAHPKSRCLLLEGGGGKEKRSGSKW